MGRVVFHGNTPIFMLIKVNRKKVLLIAAVIVALAALAIALILVLGRLPDSDSYLGGAVHSLNHVPLDMVPVAKTQEEDYGERFQRPSKKESLPGRYTFSGFEQSEKEVVFEKAEDVIYAYYGVLREASNMEGYSGGCGSIGDAKAPYPYAYDLLTQSAKEKQSFNEFEDSFKGTGHITFLQIYELESPKDSDDGTKNFMVEIEVITGKKTNEDSGPYNKQSSYFAYYYGVVSVSKDEESWAIQKIDYYPEEFLCAPYHSWFYDSGSVVDIIFIENLKAVDKVTRTTQTDSLISIYASGNAGRYRFDFVRLTNGHDILINEYVYKGANLEYVELLTNDWEGIKLTPENN